MDDSANIVMYVRGVSEVGLTDEEFSKLAAAVDAYVMSNLK
jgi:hypothetical protein